MFLTSFDRFLAADKEYLLFTLSKNSFPVEKYEIMRGAVFQEKLRTRFRARRAQNFL
jgi:hypothetical protein